MLSCYYSVTVELCLNSGALSAGSCLGRKVPLSERDKICRQGVVAGNGMREILSAVERFLFEHLLTHHLDVTRLSCRQGSTLFHRLRSGDRLPPDRLRQRFPFCVLGVCVGPTGCMVLLRGRGLTWCKVLGLSTIACSADTTQE